MRRLGAVLVCIVVMWGLASCTLFGQSGSASSAPGSQATQVTEVDTLVSEDGFILTLGDITVTGLPGVAPVGTRVTMSWIDDPDAAFIADLQGIESGPPVFGVSMDEGRQPASPITVSWKIPDGKGDLSTLAFATRSTDTGLWSGIPVTVSGSLAYVSLDHLSWCWFGWDDNVVNWLIDQFTQSLDQTFDKPDCAGQPLTINGTQWTVATDNDGVFACLEDMGSQVGVTIHSADNKVWHYWPVFGEADGLKGVAPAQAGPMLTLGAYYAEERAYPSETILVPGGTASIVPNEGVTYTFAQAQTDTMAWFVNTLIGSVDAVLGLAGVESLPTNQNQAMDDAARCILYPYADPNYSSYESDEPITSTFWCLNHLLTNQTSFVVSILESLISSVDFGIQMYIPTTTDSDLVTVIVTNQELSSSDLSEFMAYNGLPEQWHGTWCSAVTESKCINLADLFEQWPGSTLYLTDNGDSSITDLEVCLGGSCSGASTVPFDYLPVGVGWDCLSEAANFRETSCDPDYTSYHDISKPRLKFMLYHEQGPIYVDTEPLYQDPSATGTYGDLSAVAEVNPNTGDNIQASPH